MDMTLMSLLLGLVVLSGIVKGEEFYSLDDLKANKGLLLKIQNSDCELQGTKDGCNYRFTKKTGTCPFTLTYKQLTPTVDLVTLSNKFIATDKFNVEEMAFDTCSDQNMLQFKLKTKESYDIVPQYITLAANSIAKIGWKHTESQLLFKKIKIDFDGVTSIANDHAVNIKLDKPINRDDFDIAYTVASVNVKDFLQQFGIDAEQLKPISDTKPTKPVFPSSMNTEKERLGLRNLLLESPTVSGILAPGQGFELTAKGTVTAPELLSDASNLYIIIQDFKKPDADAAQETYDTPAAALFASYDSENVAQILYTLTGQILPTDLHIFQGANEVCITAATRAINFINTPELRLLTDKFTPAKGFDVIEQGLKVMHFAVNSDPDYKDQDKQVFQKFLFRVGIAEQDIVWKSPQTIETIMRKMAYLAWRENKGVNRFPIAWTTKCRYDKILFNKIDSSINVDFNLTQPVQVLDDDIVTLLNSTIRLTSTKNVNRGVYRQWELTGWGKESILGELQDIELYETDKRTVVAANANLFNMAEVRNRTRATYLPEEYVEPFNFTLFFPISELRYEAVFQWSAILKFKGTADFVETVGTNAALEIMRYTKRDKQPGIKVGLLFRNVALHKVVNAMYKSQRMVQSTWVVAANIALVFKKEPTQHKFDRNILAFVDSIQNFESGIAIAVEDLDVKICGIAQVEVSMCRFLQNRFTDKIFPATFEGRLYPDRMHMQAAEVERIRIGKNLLLRRAVARIRSNNQGDKIALAGNIYFRVTDETFQGSISMDGSNDLIFKIRGEYRSDHMFPLQYVVMDPLQALFRIPTGDLQVVEFNSRLFIGTAQTNEAKCKFIGTYSRQYVGLEDPEYFRLFAKRDEIKVQKVLSCFEMAEPESLIKGARFKELMVAYNSQTQIWQVPEADNRVHQGFWFLGKLYLKTGGIYHSSMKLTGTASFIVKVELLPTRYGPKVMKNGKMELERTSLFLYNRKEDTDVGPVLEVTISSVGATQRIVGYLETIGLEKTFEMTTTMKPRKVTAYRIELQGSIYNEVPGATIILTAEGVGLPTNMDVQYKLTLTDQIVSRGSADLRDACSQVQTDARKGKQDAVAAVQEVTQIRAQYAGTVDAYRREMEGIDRDVRRVNNDIDSACRIISESCINKCKTVPLAGLDMKEDCVESSGRRVQCMVWNEDKEKCVNVVCLLKCEAKKVAASNDACKNKQELRLMYNRYKELSILKTNKEKILALIDEVKEIVVGAKTMIDEKTNIEEEITGLLSLPADSNLVTVNTLKVDSPLNDLKPPCLPFDLDFVLNTSPPRTYSGVEKSDICFNGEFYKNVALEILKKSYPTIDDMYKTLEEAKLRYIKANAMKKSLLKTEKQMESDDYQEIASKRSNTKDKRASVRDPVQESMFRSAERRIPKFTTRGDNTMLAFSHYSPWAVAGRMHPFASLERSKPAKKFNIEAITGGKPCMRAKRVVGEYRDIITGLKTVISNYKKGKITYHEKRNIVQRELDEAYKELHGIANATNLAPVEVKDMFYWYHETKKGMDTYFGHYSRLLDQHNKRGFNLWKTEMNGIYGSNNGIGELDRIGRDAYTRSNIEHATKEDSVNSLSGIKNGLNELMHKSQLSLEDANPVVDNLSNQVESLHKSTLSCF